MPRQHSLGKETLIDGELPQDVIIVKHTMSIYGSLKSYDRLSRVQRILNLFGDFEEAVVCIQGTGAAIEQIGAV